MYSSIQLWYFAQGIYDFTAVLYSEMEWKPSLLFPYVILAQQS